MPRSSPGRIFASSCVRGTRCRRCCSSCSRRSSSFTSRCRRERATTRPTAYCGSRSSSPRSSASGGLLLAPCDRSTIWLGKAVATLCFLGAVEVVALPAFALFFAPLDATAVAGVVLTSIGISAVGALLSAMAAVGRGRDVILPVLFLPLAVPLIVGGVGASISSEGGRFLLFLVLYDAVFAILAWASFEYVVTE